MVTSGTKQLRKLLAESDLLPPVRFRVGDSNLILSRPCLTAAHAIAVARELGATRIDFILSDRSHIEFRQLWGLWQAQDMTTLRDVQLLLDRASASAIAARADASLPREQDSRSLSGRHARRDLVELRTIQDSDLCAQAAGSMLRCATANADYRQALCRAAAPGAKSSQHLVVQLLQGMVSDAAKRPRGLQAARALADVPQVPRRQIGCKPQSTNPDVSAQGGRRPPQKTEGAGGNNAGDDERKRSVRSTQERPRNG